MVFVSLTTIYHISPLYHSLIATLQLGLLDCHNNTRKCWNKLKTLYIIQALVWHVTMKRQWKPKLYSYKNVSSIPLCISYYAGNDYKGNANMVWVALGKHQIAQQLVGHPCSVRSEKQTFMAENSFDWCWCAWCIKTLSKSIFKHANCLLSLTRYQGIPASVPSRISWMNARYEATTVGREMWMTHNVVCIIIDQGLKNIQIFSSRPRPRPFFMSLRRLKTKTKVSRLHLC